MGRFSQMALLSVLVVRCIVAGEGKPWPDFIFGSSDSVIPGMDEFKTNLNLKNIGDVITGNRFMSAVVTRDGKLEVNAGVTDEEKLIYGSIGIFKCKDKDDTVFCF